MSKKKKSNGANGSNGHSSTTSISGSKGRARAVEDALSDAQMELLRHALVEHGKRMGALEGMLNKALDDLMLMKDIVARTQARVRKIAEKLGVNLDD